MERQPYTVTHERVEQEDYELFTCTCGFETRLPTEFKQHLKEEEQI